MAAMFTRQKMVGWMAVVFALQSYLNEPNSSITVNPDKPKQPAIFSIGMSFMALFVVSIMVYWPL